MGVINFVSKFLTNIRNTFLRDNNNLSFGKQMKQQRIIRISTYIGLVVVAIYAICFINPPFHDDASHAATHNAVASDTILSLSIENSSLALNLTPVSANGTFMSTADTENHAVINVATNNITGYTLSIQSNNSDTARNLVSTGDRCVDTPTADKCFIETLTESVSKEDYEASTATDLNNTWGYLPSKYNSVDNTNYLPAPTANGDILDTTDAPNTLKQDSPVESTDIDDLEENEYTIDLGSRVDYSTYADSYANTFIITAVGNPVPYSVAYDANKPEQAPATANVDNIPHPQTGTVSSGDTIAVVLDTKVPTIGNENPNTGEYTYAGYVFNGWCNAPTETPAEINGQTNTQGYQICPEGAEVYQPGDNYGINQIEAINTETLYAIWGAPATVTFNSNGLIYDNTAGNTENTVEYIPTYEGNKVTGQRQNILYTGTYKTPAYEETTPTTNYMLKGWSTDQATTEATYTNEQDIINNLNLAAGDNINLYAVWTYATMIIFDKNGADGTETMEPQYMEAGTTGQLEQNVYTNTGLVLGSWNTEADGGGTEYLDQGDFYAEPGQSNDVTLYAQWEVPTLYDKVAAMSKGTQTFADMKDDIAAPTSDNPTMDESNSGVYKYDAATFGTASDASNDYNIYYYRGILEPEADQGSYGSDGNATTYPNYVKLGNNTCWRIVRTTGSGGVKMIYNGIWTGSTCANNQANAALISQSFASQGTSSKYSDWDKNIHYVGYTFNNSVTDKTSSYSVDTVFGSDANPRLNNTRSNIKTYIEDTWYANNMTTYTNMLESSAGYCNDRTAYSSGYTLSTVIPYSTSNATVEFGAYNRNIRGKYTGEVPSLTCPRSTVDLYRYVIRSAGVANELKYPAALITADELSFAGSGPSSQVPNYDARSFMNSGSIFLSLSPFERTSIGYTFGSSLETYGALGTGNLRTAFGVRPVISLKSGMTVVDGDGTATNPWTINEQ